MINNIIIIVVTLLSLTLLFQPKVRNSSNWRATITPLASIIGSGFLVSVPLLVLTTGHWATIAMIMIVTIAYGIGSSIRFNIEYFEPLLESRNRLYQNAYRIEWLSKPILSTAYVISVAFYLKLLSAFVIRGIGFSSLLAENILTTAILIAIGITGKVRGLSLLESYEIYSVNTKLAIITALIVGHISFNIEHVIDGSWVLKLDPHNPLLEAIQKLLGSLIIVQGFETSRFLGHAYSQKLRIKTMRAAQLISAAIYITFTASAMIVFNHIHAVSETAIIDICGVVAPVLPFLLIIAACMSQFSAAVADTIGSGGLLSEFSRKKISANSGYFLVSIFAIGLTWLTNIYEIIVIASKAFAIYYALQLLIAIILLHKDKTLTHQWRKRLLFYSLFFLMVLVVIFGKAVE